MTLPVLRLHKGDAPFCDAAENSYTIPARFYRDPEIYALEKDAIFYRNWWLAGHKSQLAEPGAYLTTAIHEQSVVITRGRDGELRAFYNVCQHRGHELTHGCGKASVLVCPYHAWSYELDGSLRSARNTKEMAGVRQGEFRPQAGPSRRVLRLRLRQSRRRCRTAENASRGS